jgi:hypothetical protein
VVPEPADTEPTTPTFLRRFGGWVVDWVLSSLFVFLVLPYDLVLEPGARPPMFLGAPQSSWVVLGVFALYTTLFVGLTGGRTLGHRVVGLQVWQVRPGSFLLQSAVRAVLVSLVLPAIIPARGDRCLADAWAGTRIVRP